MSIKILSLFLRKNQVINQLGILTFATIFTLTSVCSTGTSSSNNSGNYSNKDVNGIAGAWTNDPDMGAVFVHTNGEKLIALTQRDANGNVIAVEGAIWRSPLGHTIVVTNGNDGLPEQAIIANQIVLFRNYANNKVDIAIVDPDGSVHIARAVPVDIGGFPNKSAQSSRTGATNMSKLLELADVLSWASATISVAICVAGAIGAIPSLGTTLPLLAACGGAALALTNLVVDNSLLEGSSVALGAIGCGTGTLLAECIGFILDMGASTLVATDAIITYWSNEIEAADEALTYGSGECSTVSLSYTNSDSADNQRGGSDVIVGQSFTAVSNNVSGFQLAFGAVNGSLDQGGKAYLIEYPSETILAQKNFSVSPGYVGTLDFMFDNPVNVTPGNLYFVGIETLDPAYGINIYRYTSPYAGGCHYEYVKSTGFSSSFSTCGNLRDAHFKIYTCSDN